MVVVSEAQGEIVRMKWFYFWVDMAVLGMILALIRRARVSPIRQTARGFTISVKGDSRGKRTVLSFDTSARQISTYSTHWFRHSEKREYSFNDIDFIDLDTSEQNYFAQDIIGIGGRSRFTYWIYLVTKNKERLLAYAASESNNKYAAEKYYNAALSLLKKALQVPLLGDNNGAAENKTMPLCQICNRPVQAGKSKCLYCGAVIGDVAPVLSETGEEAESSEPVEPNIEISEEPCMRQGNDDVVYKPKSVSNLVWAFFGVLVILISVGYFYKPAAVQGSASNTGFTKKEEIEMARFFKPFMEERGRISETYKADMEAVGIPSLFSLQRLKADTELSESRAIVANAKSVIDNYENMILSQLVNVRISMNKLNISADKKKMMIAGMDAAMKDGKIRAAVDCERQILGVYEEMIECLANNDKWYADDDRMVFADSKQRDTFNAFYLRVQEISNHQQRLALEMAYDSSDFMNFFNRNLAGSEESNPRKQP